MPTIDQLQKAIDEKRIDTRKLAPEQKDALDAAFKAGELKGYEGLQDYENLIDLSAKSLAAGKEVRLKGAESAGLPSRENMVLYGAAGMAMVPYFKDQQALIDAFQKNGFKDFYGIDTRFAKGADIYGKRLSTLKEGLKDLKFLPRKGIVGLPVRAFGSVLGVIDDTINFFSKVGKYGASPAAATEAASILYGAGGAFGGNAAYEIASLGTDFVGAVNQDLANLTDNDLRKLPFGERLLVGGLIEAQNDMLWAGGALGLIPAARFAKRGTKGLLGLNSEQSKEIARSYERLGVKPNVVSLIPGNNAFQNFFKKFFSTIGVYPLVSGPLSQYNKEFNKQLTQEQFLKIMDNLNLPPAVNNSIMNYAGVNEIKNEWKSVWAAIDREYDDFDSFWKQINNPNFIPTDEVRKVTKQIIEDLKNNYPRDRDIFFQLEKGARELTDADDPMVAFIKYLNDLGGSSEKPFIRISDWKGLSRMNTAAYTNSKYKTVKDSQLLIRNALERDLNSMNVAANRDVLKTNIFKSDYDRIAADEGAEMAERFIDDKINYAKAAFSRLQEANTFYSMVLRPYEKTKVGRQLLKADSKLFADKGIEMMGRASLAPDEVFDSVIRRVLAGNSPDSVKQLKQIMGITKSEYKIFNDQGKLTRTVQIPVSERSKAVYDRYVKQFFWDAWNDSTQFPLRDLKSLSAERIAAIAETKGFKTDRIFKLKNEIEQRVRAKTRTDETLNLTDVDARIFTEGNGVANVNEGLIRKHNFGEVDIDKFVKNIGIDNNQGRDKIREIFGGGAQGEKALQKLDDIIAVKRSLDSVDFTDPSKFVQRSLTLRAGSGGGILAGATSAAFGFGNTLKLILGSRLLGSVLTNPKVGENVMELNKFYRYFSDDPNVVALKPQLMPRARTAYARAINSIFEAEQDDYRVDPNRIDFEEVRQKLLSLDPNIPLTNKYDFSTMPQFTRDRIYPEGKYAKQLNAIQRSQGDQYLQGASLISKSDDQFQQVMNGNPIDNLRMEQQAQQAAAPQPQVLQAPGQQPMATGQMPQAPEQRAATYQALFPQDTLGTAIAAQGQQFSEGGLVQDAYAYADEVLNA